MQILVYTGLFYAMVIILQYYCQTKIVGLQTVYDFVFPYKRSLVYRYIINNNWNFSSKKCNRKQWVMSECTRQNNHCGNLRCQLYCNYCLRNIVYISLSAQQRKQAIYCRFYRSKFRKQILVQGINGVLLIFIFDLLGKKKFHDMVQVMIIIYHINPTLLNFNEQLTYNFFFFISEKYLV